MQQIIIGKSLNVRIYHKNDRYLGQILLKRIIPVLVSKFKVLSGTNASEDKSR